MKGILKFFLAFLLCGFVLNGCQDKQDAVSEADSPSQGTIRISVDESFKPVIEEQIKVYKATYPATEIIATYKPEAECILDFFRDSATRMVIITRSLSDKEEKYLADSLNYRPSWNVLATDAIALIVNAKSADTLITLERLKAQLTGKINRDQSIVFDGLSATSTLRFITDSVLKGDKLDPSVVKGARTSKDVIDLVAADENAIGLIGISWIGNPEDTAQLNLLKKVKIAYVNCEWCEGKPFVKPMQESIMSKRYPLVRGLYYAIRENYNGLGTGFVSFMKLERGQLIFRRAYLGSVMDFDVRNIRINEKLPNN